MDLDLEAIRNQAKERNRNLIPKKSKAKDQHFAKVSEELKEVVNLLLARLENAGKFTIAIDGVDGSGKSSFARYLAWQLNLSAVETDLCKKQKSPKAFPDILNGEIPPIETDLDILQRLIQARHRMHQPIIVEGIFVLQSLKDAGVKPDFIILLTKSGWDGSFDFTAYRKKFHNSPKPDVELDWESCNSVNL